MAPADQAAQRLTAIDATGHRALMAYFAIRAGLCQGNVDTVLVDVQTRATVAAVVVDRFVARLLARCTLSAPRGAALWLGAPTVRNPQ
ncbi:MAG: hypothetical protein EOP82_28405 [Variovorax sp.]|nr:MAG: hypothetical protein EOP82_28405 [Variovorax sp.]